MATMTLTINIADAEVQKVKDGICKAWGYDPAADGSQTSFIKKGVIDRLKQAYQEAMTNDDSAASRARIATALSDANLS